MEHSDESTSSAATSAISTPASSGPCILINIPPDLLENIFLRVPSQQYPQIRRTCRALKGFLDESMFLGRYIEKQVVEHGEIMVPVKLGWRSRLARYRNRCSGRVSWKLGCNIGSCYYRCYNIRKFKWRENGTTPVPCHAGLFCPWIECATWHKWFDAGFVRTFLRNRAPEFENNTSRPRRRTTRQLCSVCSCSSTRLDSCCSCMVSLLCIKNPITGIYKTLPFIDGRWTSKLKCIVRYDQDHFKVLVAMPANTAKDRHHKERVSFVKTMIYDSIINSWREMINDSGCCLQNIKVVDTHGVYCKGAMYWLLKATQNLIIFWVEKERWEILEVRKPECDHPLGMFVCKEQVLMAGTKDKVLVIWKLIQQSSFNQSHKKEGEWKPISESTEEIFNELQNTEMAIHSACIPNGDDIVCFENLLNKMSVTFNVNTMSWDRSNDIHAI